MPTIPSTYQAQNLRELNARSPVLASSWSTTASDHGIAEALNLLWARSGVRLGGHIWGDTPFATTFTSSTSYTTTNDNAGLNMDEMSPCGSAERAIEGNLIKFTFGAVMEDCDMRVRIYNANTSTLIATLTASKAGAGTEFVDNTQSVAVADTQDASGNPALLYAVADARANTTQAKVYGFAVFESVIINAAELPTGA